MGTFPIKRHGRFFLVLMRKSQADGRGRLGIVAGSKTVPLSVNRSLIKRAVREVYRHARGDLGPMDVVVRVRGGAGKRDLPELRRELERLFGPAS
jgi:ribonuclease P protein component